MSDIDRLSDRLRSMTSNNYGPEDPEWYQFVMDHRSYLESKATKVIHTTLELVPFRYKPELYYIKQHQGEQTQAWIFCMLNNIRDVSEFNESRQTFIVPDPKTIVELHQKFSASLGG